jgi:hypothetical protein
MHALPGPGHSAQSVITRVEALHSFNTTRPAYAAGASVIGFHGHSRPHSTGGAKSASGADWRLMVRFPFSNPCDPQCRLLRNDQH